MKEWPRLILCYVGAAFLIAAFWTWDKVKETFNLRTKIKRD